MPWEVGVALLNHVGSQHKYYDYCKSRNLNLQRYASNAAPLLNV